MFKFTILPLKPYKKRHLTSRQDEGLTERIHHMNLTLQEDEITKRQPYKKTGRKPFWKMESAFLASKSCTELGPAQPRLVILFYTIGK